MVIAFTCSCGKRLQAKPELAGKKVKCPGCQALVAIPAAKPTPSAAVTSLTCKCGRKLQVKGAAPGKRVKCPGCQGIVQIPGAVKSTAPVKSSMTKVAATMKAPAKAAPTPAKPTIAAKSTTAPGRLAPPRSLATNTSAAPPASVKPLPKAGAEKAGASVKVLAGGGGVVVLALLAWFFLMGDSSTGTVEGKIILDNEPLADAEIAFVNEKLGVFQSKTDPNGKYQLYGNKGRVPVGKYKVTISKLVMLDGRAPEGEEGAAARTEGKLKNLLPPHFSEPEKTTQSAEVKAGENTVDFSVTRAP